MIIYQNEEIIPNCINNLTLKSFGWIDFRGIDFEIELNAKLLDNFNINSRFECNGYNIRFEFVTNFKIKLNETVVKIDRFKYDFADSQVYKISITTSQNGYIQFECYNFYLETNINL